MPQNFTPLDLKATPISHQPEVEPVAPKGEIKVQEMVEHEPHEEVLPYVQIRKETIKLPQEVKEETGAEEVSTTQFPSAQSLNLPISDEEVESGLHQPINSSWRWLAELCVYLLKQVHLTLKKIHGKTIRVKN